MSGSGKTSKTTQENNPPAWAQPLFTKSASEAGSLYDSGRGGRTFPGSTVAPLSGTTMQGVNQLAQAGQGWDTSGTRNLYQGIGEAAVSNPFMGELGDLAGHDQLEGYMSGDYLKGEGNPFYRQRLEREIGDSNALINSNFSGAGRYGSPGAHQGVIADNTSNMLLEGLEDDFNRQTQNQFNAFNTAGNMLNSAGGMYGTGIGQAQGAADAMSGLDQRNFENQRAGARDTLEAGNILDTQARKNYADQIGKWYGQDNEGWNRLSLLQSAAAGAAGPYGVQTATMRQPMDIGGVLRGIGSLFGGKG